MDTLKAVTARKSVRSYQNKAVEASKIETLIGAANSAPFAGPFHISVVLNKDLLTELDHKTLTAMKNSGIDFLQKIAQTPGYKPIFEVPLLFVFSAPEENPYGAASCANAATTAAIVATDLGLGSCYVVTPTLVLTQDADMCRKIGVPDGFKAACCLTVGYTDDPEKGRTPRQKGDNVNYAR